MNDPQIAADLQARSPRARAELLDAYGDRLFQYCWLMLRNREIAQITVRDTLVAAQAHIARLADPAEFGSWLYSLARAECMWHWAVPAVEADETPSRPDQPDADSRLMAWNAAMSLEVDEIEALELTCRHDVDLATVLGVSAAEAEALVARARGHLEAALGAEIVINRASLACPDRAEVLSGWTGTTTPEIRDQVLAHAADCPVCGPKLPRNVSASRVLAQLPAPSLSPDARADLLGEQTRDPDPGTEPEAFESELLDSELLDSEPVESALLDAEWLADLTDAVPAPAAPAAVETLAPGPASAPEPEPAPAPPAVNTAAVDAAAVNAELAALFTNHPVPETPRIPLSPPIPDRHPVRTSRVAPSGPYVSSALEFAPALPSSPLADPFPAGPADQPESGRRTRIRGAAALVTGLAALVAAGLAATFVLSGSSGTTVNLAGTGTPITAGTGTIAPNPAQSSPVTRQAGGKAASASPVSVTIRQPAVQPTLPPHSTAPAKGQVLISSVTRSAAPSAAQSTGQSTPASTQTANGTLTVSPTSFDLDTTSSGAFTLAASGGAVTWGASSSSTALSLGSSQGTLAAGQSEEVTFSVNRAQNASGNATITVTVGSAPPVTIDVSWSASSTGTGAPSPVRSGHPGPRPSGSPSKPAPTVTPTSPSSSGSSDPAARPSSSALS